MKLQLTKNSGKPHVIKYIRDNGSATWMYADDFFVQHDLSHYAIEKTLHYTTAFMGMLNEGMEIKDFESREKRMQMTITQEAMYAENMANLFLWETTQGNFDDFNGTVRQAFETFNTQYPAPSLSEKQLSAIRILFRQLLQRWFELPVSETMTLNFEF
jgi:hypothetical protein